MTDEAKKQVTEYVHLNYKMYKNKPLIIKEKENCFHIAIHEDSSPLILGKRIIKR